jgi:hypothetical protein
LLLQSFADSQLERVCAAQTFASPQLFSAPQLFSSPQHFASEHSALAPPHLAAAPEWQSALAPVAGQDAHSALLSVHSFSDPQ